MFYRDAEGLSSDTDQGYYDHDCEKPDGSFVSIDFIRVAIMPRKSFREWVDLTYPTRYTFGAYHEPLSTTEIATEWDRKFAVRP